MTPVPFITRRVRLRPEALFGRRAISTPTAPEETPVEQRLAELFDHLGITRAHLAGRAGTDWQGLAARHPERVVSLTLLCPAALDRAALQPLSSRLLVVTGDQGPGAWRRAVAQAESDGTYFVAQPFHCAVGTKPA